MYVCIDLEEAEGEDHDFQEKMEQDEDAKNEEDLLGYYYFVLAKILKLNGRSFLGHWVRALEQVVEAMMKQPIPALTTTGLCMFGQIIHDCFDEPSPEGRAILDKYSSGILPIAFQAALSADSEQRLAGVFTIGACAKCSPSLFVPHASRALSILLSVIEVEDSRDEDNNSVTEAAISAVAKIMDFCPSCLPCDAEIGGGAGVAPVQRPSSKGISSSSKGKKSKSRIPKGQVVHVTLDKLLPMWLEWLPVTDDDLEAQDVANRLVSLIRKYEMKLLGSDYSGLPQLLRVLGEIVGTNLVNPSTHPQIVELLRHFQSKGLLDAVASHLDEKQKERLQQAIVGFKG